MEYEKCKNCNLYGRASDAPPMVEKDCLHHLEPDYDENGICIDEPPCEREGR